ncbi:hypothetical protein Pelo_14747 [Pelomyxa schiedti]|nr:hypothetical protein Pelo_14747 [Pelomyxa schiedti]
MQRCAECHHVLDNAFYYVQADHELKYSDASTTARLFDLCGTRRGRTLADNVVVCGSCHRKILSRIQELRDQEDATASVYAKCIEGLSTAYETRSVSDDDVDKQLEVREARLRQQLAAVNEQITQLTTEDDKATQRERNLDALEQMYSTGMNTLVFGINCLDYKKTLKTCQAQTLPCVLMLNFSVLLSTSPRRDPQIRHRLPRPSSPQLPFHHLKDSPHNRSPPHEL